jgi:phage gpG-like protein
MNNISQDLRRKIEAVKTYRRAIFPQQAGKAAMAFIDSNFRKQSWEGTPWRKRKGGKRNKGRALLMNRGTLRRGNKFKTGDGTTTLYNDVPYAAAHNNGFHGPVNIKAHKRRTYRKAKLSSVATRRTRTAKVSTGSSDVKAHSRNMHINRRQYMPTNERPSQTLSRTIRKAVHLEMLKIMKP